MWCQWSSSYHLRDDPLRSAQHEYRFPTIIQLDEVGPPPPSSHKDLLSSVPSSSQSYDFYSSSGECEEVEGEEEEEEATESYCSSDLSGPGFGTGDLERASAMASSAPVEQMVKMSRVLAWRNSFDNVFVEDNAAVLMSLKRKYSHETEDGENGEVASQSGSGAASDVASTSRTTSRRSKRSRTASSSCSSSWSLPSPLPQVPPLPSDHAHVCHAYICSACDASFLALEQLQDHSGSDHEACRIAAQYGFE